MNSLTPFEYRGEALRTVVIDDEPWFVAADVCTMLDHSNPSAAVAGLDDDEKGLRNVETPGGVQALVCVNEPGLYSLIIRSRKPEAKAFKRWVTHEVLPSIRKTGGYGVPTGLTFEEMTARVITELQSRIDAAQEQAKALEAPAGAWNDLSKAEGDYTVSDAAKILARADISTGPRKLYDWLQAHGWVFRRGGRWQAMQSAINAGLVVERVTAGYFDQVTGERKQADPQVRITPRGVERLRELLLDERSQVELA